jgi:uncharacterized membrane protein YtjA (UPF0391 family)
MSEIVTSSGSADNRSGRKESHMLYYALMFLVVGLLAGALGAFGVAAMATQIAWILFVIGVVLIVIHLVAGRGDRVLRP